MSGLYEFDTTTLRFTYSSMTTRRRCSTTTWRRARASYARPRKSQAGTTRPTT
jgi:hypothetical protein